MGKKGEGNFGTPRCEILGTFARAERWLLSTSCFQMKLSFFSHWPLRFIPTNRKKSNTVTEKATYKPKVVPIYVAGQRGLDLSSIDFMIGGTPLDVLANR